MKIEAKDPQDYISKLPEERQEPFAKLRQTILDNIPDGLHDEFHIHHSTIQMEFNCCEEKDLIPSH